MKTFGTLLATMLALGFAEPTFAQSQSPQDHQQHHPGDAKTPAQPAPSPAPPPSGMMQGGMMGQMMQRMPENCRAAMQNMPQSCMGMMRQMMQGNAASHDTHGAAADTPPSTKAYLEAANKMHGPMMEGMKESDPDGAFVKGMIPHHQGAIDMAKVLLQYGKDAETRKLANEIIQAQEREIGEMQAWLKKRGH
jgi:uncharacterized protein (DUF305 family)